MGVSTDEDTDGSRSAVGKDNGLFQLWDRFGGLIFGDQCEAHKPMSECVVWPECEGVPHILNHPAP